MTTLKQTAIDAISKMEDPVDVDEIMYRLYVIDKIEKGRNAADRGELTSIEELRTEVEKW